MAWHGRSSSTATPQRRSRSHAPCNWRGSTSRSPPKRNLRLDASTPGAYDLAITPGSNFARWAERFADEQAQRQSTEAALLDAEAMYRSFAEGLPINLICKDLDSRFRFVNGLFCRELGKSLEQIVGKTDYDFFSKELAEQYQADDREVVATRRVLQKVEEHRLPNGERRYVEVIKAPVYNAAGAVSGIQIAFWDVTSRKRAEQELLESESRNRAILQAALDCIVTIDQEGKIIEFNPAAEATFGFRRDEIVGKDLAENLFPPPSRDRHRDALDRYGNLGEMGSMLGQRFEQTLVRKGGERFTAEMAMQPIPLEGKTVFTVFLRDITERKRAEEEINRKNRDLETLLYVTSHDSARTAQGDPQFRQAGLRTKRRPARRERSGLSETSDEGGRTARSSARRCADPVAGASARSAPARRWRSMQSWPTCCSSWNRELNRNRRASRSRRIFHIWPPTAAGSHRLCSTWLPLRSSSRATANILKWKSSLTSLAPKILQGKVWSFAIAGLESPWDTPNAFSSSSKGPWGEKSRGPGQAWRSCDRSPSGTAAQPGYALAKGVVRSS